MLWVPFVLAAGMILQSLGYLALFIRLYQKGIFNKILEWFKYVGKIALSNYIFQSVFYLVVFYHCTNMFQLFGKISLAETYLIAFSFFSFSVFYQLFMAEKKRSGIH